MHRFSSALLLLAAAACSQGPRSETSGAAASTTPQFVIPSRLDGQVLDVALACDESVARHCIDDDPFDLHDEASERHFTGHVHVRLASAPPDDPSGAAGRKVTVEAVDALPPATSDAWASLEDFRTYHTFTVTESPDAYAVSFLFAPGKEVLTLGEAAGTLSLAYEADVRTSHGDCERGLLLDKTATLACAASLP
jgi:hypothetical protein